MLLFVFPDCHIRMESIFILADRDRRCQESSWLSRRMGMACPVSECFACQQIHRLCFGGLLEGQSESSTLLLVCYLVILSAVTKSTCLLLPDGRICIAQEIQVSVQEGAQCHFPQLSACAQEKRGSKVE